MRRHSPRKLNNKQQRPKVSERGDRWSQEKETKGLYHRQIPEVSSQVRDVSGSFATSSFHSVENSPVCS